MNIEGKTVTIDVEPRDIIKTVKEKLQVKIDIPSHLQRLTFNGKPLIDDKSLLYYQIQKESNLRLNFQTWHRAADLEVVPGPSVDWDKVAKVAKTKVDKEVGEKKAVYENLLKKKRELVGKANKVKIGMKLHTIAESNAGQQILEKEEEIKARERRVSGINEELIKARKALQDSKHDKWNMNRQRDIETRKRLASREELDAVQVKIVKIEEEMKQTFVVAGEMLAKKNEELLKDNNETKLAMKEFLMESIVEKETLLECPVCYRTASPPIYKCTKEHLICSRCLPRVNSKCPTCRAGFPRNERIFRLAEENWRELQKLKDKVENL